MNQIILHRKNQQKRYFQKKNFDTTVIYTTLRYLIAEQDGLREQDETSSAKS